MQILRFESDDNKIYTGCDFDNESASVLEGDIYADFSNTEKRKPVKKILTPISPSVIFCIGLNYKLHAKETGMALPKYPIVFMKNISAAAGHLDNVRIPVLQPQATWIMSGFRFPVQRFLKWIMRLNLPWS